MNRTIPVLPAALAAVVLAVAVLVGFLNLTRRHAEETEMLRAELAEARRAQAMAQRGRVVEPPGDATPPAVESVADAGSDDGTGGSTAASEPGGATSDADASGEPAGGAGTSAFAEMLANPVMRDLMRQQAGAQLKVFYGDFLAKFGVGDELAQPVYDLLTERQMAVLDRVGTLMDANATPEEKEAVREEIRATMDAYGEEFRELLGDEAYGEFQFYEKTAGERMELASLEQAMSGSEEPLTPTQKDQLLAILFEEREGFEFTHDFADQTQAFENEFTPEAFATFLEEYTVLQEATRARADEVLSAAQQEAFAENQENYRNMIKAGLEMQTRMFSSGTGGGN